MGPHFSAPARGPNPARGTPKCRAYASRRCCNALAHIHLRKRGECVRELRFRPERRGHAHDGEHFRIDKAERLTARSGFGIHAHLFNNSLAAPSCHAPESFPCAPSCLSGFAPAPSVCSSPIGQCLSKRRYNSVTIGLLTIRQNAVSFPSSPYGNMPHTQLDQLERQMWIVTATIVTEVRKECRTLWSLTRAVENLLALGVPFHVERA